MYQTDSSGCPSTIRQSCRVDTTPGCVMTNNKRGEVGMTLDPLRPNYGMVIYRPDAGLRLPQRRPFLTTEYFNGGCYETHCNNASTCRYANVLASPSPETKAMMDLNFASWDPFFGAYMPKQCAFYKDPRNSTIGYQRPDAQDTLQKAVPS